MRTLRSCVGVFACFLITFCTLNVSSLWAVKSASIVICAETGKVFHEQNADAVTPPASLTKMMTLYLTFKALRQGKLTLNQKLPVSKHASLAAPCKLGLKPGSTITVREAILAMVTKSANDASIVMAEALGKGSESHFASIMTQQARSLGMSKTFFKNSHGLPHKPHSVTTARDMATLSRGLYKHFPEYFKFFKEQKFSYKGQVHPNHNRLLGRIPGLDGIKTGFINASGFNLAASIVRNNRRIIAVVMGGESAKARDNKMVKLLETTYSNLMGKKEYKTIHDLIYAFENQEAPTLKPRGKLLKAVYNPQSKPKYISMRHLLNELNEESEIIPTFKKKAKKAAPKKVNKPFKKRTKKSTVKEVNKITKNKKLKNKSKAIKMKVKSKRKN